MTSSAASPLPRNAFLSWQFALVQLLLLALAAIMLNKPVGSISGQIALQQEGFDLYTYDMKGNRVYAIAIGPRDGIEEERGVWVDNQGKFAINNLPVGEYSVKIRVPGFSTTYESGIFVDEGKVAQIAQPIQLEIAHPSVSTASNLRVFTSKETPGFWAQTSNSKSVHVRVFKKSLLDVLNLEHTPMNEKNKNRKFGIDISPDLSIYKPYQADNYFVELLEKEKPFKEFKREIANQDWSHEEFKFDKPLAPDDYVVLAETTNVKGEKDWSVTWFTVTNLGLVIKQDPEKVVARALDLSTLKPVAGVEISVLDRGSGQFMPKKVKTSADGFATIKGDDATNLGLTGNVLVCGTKGANHAYGGMNIWRSDPETLRTYFYTERPVYRLGQTVYYKGIARKLAADGFHNAGAGHKVHVKFEDPDNVELWQGDIKTTKHGSFNGLLEIPKDGKTGAYQITLTYDDGNTDYERVEVLQYRKPEYKVEVTPLEERIAAGDKGKARVRATYYFGAPVANAKVKYSIYSSPDYSSQYNLMPRPEYYGYFDDWESSSSDYDYYSGGEFVSEGYVQTDETGEAIIEFPTKAVDGAPDSIFSDAYLDHKYKVEVEVTDISRLSVLSSGNMKVTAGDFTLFVEPKHSVLPAGEKIAADVTAIDYGSQPMPKVPVTVTLMRRLWDKSKSEYRGSRVYEETTVVTDAQGKAHVDFETTTKEDFRTDTYYIIARTEDRERHKIMAQDSVWISSLDYPYYADGPDAQKQGLKVELDKPVYMPGEKARVMITAPVTGKEGAQAIVAIEGMKLYNLKVVELNATANMVEIPIEKSYAPNVFVTVTYVGPKHQFYNESQMIKVSPEMNFLKVAVETDKKKYKPGDMAEYTLKATNSQGKPAANVELSLGVVDESVYAIRPEYASDIRKFFYNQRSNYVNTLCTFPEEYSGGPNKIEPKVRKDFKDTAAWFPNLVTNKDGVVKAKIKMPDNLTTWRATVRAVTVGTEVGWTLQKVVSTQDLIVRLALPRFFCQGDEGEISAIVHNYSDIAQNIDLNLTTSGEFTINKKLADRVKIEPDKAARVSWPVKVTKAGNAVIAIKAIGQTTGDAMEVKLPIRPLGVPVYISKSGYTAEDVKDLALPVNFPDDAADGSVKTTVSLSCSSLGPVLGNFSSLIQYPYGCTEQTMSKLMPGVVAIKMNKALGIPLSDADYKKFNGYYDIAIAKLYEYNHSDGGWGWWSTDESNMYLTSLVLEGFKLLKETGYFVQEDRITRGLEWLDSSSDKLLTQLSDPKLMKNSWHEAELITDLAKSAYVRSLYGKKMSDKLKAWVTQPDFRNKLSPEALAYFTMALKKSGAADDADLMYQRLIQLANVVETGSEASLIDWERTPAMMKKLAPAKGEEFYYDSYRFTGVETTALALRTVLMMEPSNIARIEAIKQWVLTQRGKDGWGNTKTTSAVFAAFTEDEASHRETIAPEFDVQIGEAGGIPGLHFNSKSTMAPEIEQTLNLARGAQAPIIHKNGKGRLYWTVTQTYYKKLKPGDQTAVPSKPEKLSIKREFFRLVASPPDSNGKVHFKQQPLTGNVKAGETLLMRLTVDSPLTVPYSMLEAALPSGGEVVSNDPRENLAEEANESSEIETDYGWSWWWNHQDIMDDHLSFFVTSFPPGKHEVHTMVRMELPGKFQMNPVTLEGMYTDKVRGYSTANQLTVVE